MTRAATKLEPCPFCGEQPTVQRWHGGSKYKTMVSCENERCLVGPGVCQPTRKWAVLVWNERRATPEQPR